MTVTVYHGRDGVWEKTVCTDAWARWNRASSHSGGYRREDEGKSLILIPCREGLEIDPGDGIYPGEGPDISGAIKTALPRARIVTEAALHWPGSPLDHWEVTAK